MVNFPKLHPEVPSPLIELTNQLGTFQEEPVGDHCIRFKFPGGFVRAYTTIQQQGWSTHVDIYIYYDDKPVRGEQEFCLMSDAANLLMALGVASFWKTGTALDV